MYLRRVNSELLDQLSYTNPDAIRSRSDLVNINLFTRNFAWLRKKLHKICNSNDHLIELGAGDGKFSNQICNLGSKRTCVDLWPKPNDLNPKIDWLRSDVKQISTYEKNDVVFANLFIHHLTNAEISELGKKLNLSARAIIFCEPHRSRKVHYLLKIFLLLINANYVTRHDAHVSVDAGFKDNELSDLLGLDPNHWVINYNYSILGIVRFTAIRRSV